MAGALNQGDVFWCSFPAPDKARPVVILTRQVAIPVLTSVTVAPITSSIRGIRTQVVVGAEHGLRATSAISLDNIQTVRKERLSDFMAHLPDSVLREVRDALQFALGLDRLGR
jgi:mRNA interferase MazF